MEASINLWVVKSDGDNASLSKNKICLLLINELQVSPLTEAGTKIFCKTRLATAKVRRNTQENYEAGPQRKGEFMVFCLKFIVLTIQKSSQPAGLCTSSSLWEPGRIFFYSLAGFAGNFTAGTFI